MGVDKIRSSLEELSEGIERKGDKILIVGDWNARIGREQGRSDKFEGDEWFRNSEEAAEYVSREGMDDPKRKSERG